MQYSKRGLGLLLPQKQNSDSNPFRVEISGIGSASIPYITNFFLKAGQIKQIKKQGSLIIIDFTEERSVQKAMKFNGRILGDGRPITIKRTCIEKIHTINERMERKKKGEQIAVRDAKPNKIEQERVKSLEVPEEKLSQFVAKLRGSKFEFDLSLLLETINSLRSEDFRGTKLNRLMSIQPASQQLQLQHMLFLSILSCKFRSFLHLYAYKTNHETSNLERSLMQLFTKRNIDEDEIIYEYTHSKPFPIMDSRQRGPFLSGDNREQFQYRILGVLDCLPFQLPIEQAKLHCDQAELNRNVNKKIIKCRQQIQWLYATMEKVEKIRPINEQTNLEIENGIDGSRYGWSHSPSQDKSQIPHGTKQQERAFYWGSIDGREKPMPKMDIENKTETTQFYLQRPQNFIQSFRKESEEDNLQAFLTKFYIPYKPFVGQVSFLPLREIFSEYVVYFTPNAYFLLLERTGECHNISYHKKEEKYLSMSEMISQDEPSENPCREKQQRREINLFPVPQIVECDFLMSFDPQHPQILSELDFTRNYSLDMDREVPEWVYREEKFRLNRYTVVFDLQYTDYKMQEVMHVVNKLALIFDVQETAIGNNFTIIMMSSSIRPSMAGEIKQTFQKDFPKTKTPEVIYTQITNPYTLHKYCSRKMIEDKVDELNQQYEGKYRGQNIPSEMVTDKLLKDYGEIFSHQCMLVPNMENFRQGGNLRGSDNGICTLNNASPRSGEKIKRVIRESVNKMVIEAMNSSNQRRIRKKMNRHMRSIRQKPQQKCEQPRFNNLGGFSDFNLSNSLEKSFNLNQSPGKFPSNIEMGFGLNKQQMDVEEEIGIQIDTISADQDHPFIYGLLGQNRENSKQESSIAELPSLEGDYARSRNIKLKHNRKKPEDKKRRFRDQ